MGWEVQFIIGYNDSLCVEEHTPTYLCPYPFCGMEPPSSSRRRSGRMWSLGVFCILCVLKANSLTAMLNSVTLSALSNSISLVQTNYEHSVLCTPSHPLIQLMPLFLWETMTRDVTTCPAPHLPTDLCLCL